ncbi:MAG: hypothetical protein B6D55_06215 [Candidatus Omnitrophica bacterium 4484_70.2]|nr:MAG: hypothetical protein B6D55_06215 [Candidatus Omnitrophica bacterium 4484_70.2]
MKILKGLMVMVISIMISSISLYADSFTLFPERDTYIDESTPDENYEDSLFLGVGDFKDNIKYSFLQFDLSSLASYSANDVLSATLKLYSVGSSPGSGGDDLEVWSADLVDTSWDDDFNFNWDSWMSYGRWENKYSSTYVNAGYNGWVEWDVTNLVKDWLEDINLSGYILGIRNDEDGLNELAEVMFSSEAKGWGDVAPRLELTVVPEPLSVILSLFGFLPLFSIRFFRRKFFKSE